MRIRVVWREQVTGRCENLVEISEWIVGSLGYCSSRIIEDVNGTEYCVLGWKSDK